MIVALIAVGIAVCVVLLLAAVGLAGAAIGEVARLRRRVRLVEALSLRHAVASSRWPPALNKGVAAHRPKTVH